MLTSAQTIMLLSIHYFFSYEKKIDTHTQAKILELVVVVQLAIILLTRKQAKEGVPQARIIVCIYDVLAVLLSQARPLLSFFISQYCVDRAKWWLGSRLYVLQLTMRAQKHHTTMSTRECKNTIKTKLFPSQCSSHIEFLFLAGKNKFQKCFIFNYQLITHKHTYQF